MKSNLTSLSARMRFGIAAAAAALAITGCGGGAKQPAAQATAAPVALPSTDPVVQNAGDGILIGSGWYPVEHFKGATFRWATNDAEVTACPDANNRTLALRLEPGPSINGTAAPSATVTVIGNHGDHASASIKGQQQFVKVRVADGVPAETFSIHVNSANRRAPNGDKRILNYRLLSAVLGSSIADCKKEIVRDGSPLAIGNNWFKYETYAGQSFRWVNNNAQLKLTQAEKKPFALELNVAVGPSLGGAPLKLTVRDSHGRSFAAKPVNPTVYPEIYVAFDLPAEPAGTVLTLSAPSKNVAVPSDPRTLNFRVFDAKVKP